MEVTTADTSMWTVGTNRAPSAGQSPQARSALVLTKSVVPFPNDCPGHQRHVVGIPRRHLGAPATSRAKRLLERQFAQAAARLLAESPQIGCVLADGRKRQAALQRKDFAGQRRQQFPPGRGIGPAAAAPVRRKTRPRRPAGRSPPPRRADPPARSQGRDHHHGLIRLEGAQGVDGLVDGHDLRKEAGILGGVPGTSGAAPVAGRRSSAGRPRVPGAAPAGRPGPPESRRRHRTGGRHPATRRSAGGRRLPGVTQPSLAARYGSSSTSSGSGNSPFDDLAVLPDAVADDQRSAAAARHHRPAAQLVATRAPGATARGWPLRDRPPG